MQDKIIGAVGIFIAIVCTAAGWWFENGPVRKDPDQDPDDSKEQKRDINHTKNDVE